MPIDKVVTILMIIITPINTHDDNNTNDTDDAHETIDNNKYD